MMAPFPHGWMKWWNGLGSAIHHGNCVHYRHDNLQRRRKKNETRKGGKQWKGSNQGWQDKPWQILSLNFQLRLFLLCPSSSRFMNHRLADLSITCPLGPLSGRCCSANGVIEVWKTISYKHDGCFVLMESSKYGIQPDQRIQLGNYHLWAQTGTQVSRGLLRCCVPLGLETLFVLYSMLSICGPCSGEAL